VRAKDGRYSLKVFDGWWAPPLWPDRGWQSANPPRSWRASSSMPRRRTRSILWSGQGPPA